MLERGYSDLNVLSIAASSDDMSFSSDTGMAECLVIARKAVATVKQIPPDQIAHFTSLRLRPSGFAQASAIAKRVTENDHVRCIEDGPYGGTSVSLGDSVAGEMLTAITDKSGENWASVRILDYSIAQTAYGLAGSKLWLPGSAYASELRMTPLRAIGRTGLHHRDITGPAPRGAFTKTAASPTATYPALWSHVARNESRIVCYPDSQLQVRQGLEDKALMSWATASRSHLNRDFRFNSQPLSVAITARATIGGRAWPNVIFEDARFDFAFGTWSNCTLGLVMHWWHSNRQQSGRGTSSVRALESSSVLDFRALTDDQLATAEDIFNDFLDRELKPAYLADADPNRALLDRRVVCDLLGFDEGIYKGVRRLAAKWCARTIRPRRQGPPQGSGDGDVDEVGALFSQGVLPFRSELRASHTDRPKIYRLYWQRDATTGNPILKAS